MTTLKMYSSITNLRLLCIYLFLPCALLAAPSKLESNSPFLPPGYSTLKASPPKPVQRPNSPLARDLEFRGVVQLNGAYQFSLFKKSENRGYWIPEDGTENGITVNSFDSASMLITVTANGQSEQLGLMSASENPLPVVTNSPAAAGQNLPPLPPSIQTQASTQNKQPSRRTIPRRRVILPPKN